MTPRESPRAVGGARRAGEHRAAVEVAIDVVDELTHARVAARRLLLEAMADDRVEVARERPLERLRIEAASAGRLARGPRILP